MADVLDQRVLDDLLASVGGDEAFFSELVSELLADAPSQLETLRAAAAAGDSGSAQRAAHTLKGNARTFGASGLATLCQEAEAAAAGGDLAGVASRLDAIESAWASVRRALEAERAG